LSFVTHRVTKDKGPARASSTSARKRRFRVALGRDGVEAVELEKAGGKFGRTVPVIVPVIENTLAFTIGREDAVVHGTGAGRAP